MSRVRNARLRTSSELGVAVASHLRRGRRVARAAFDLSSLCLGGHTSKARLERGRTPGPDDVVVAPPSDAYSSYFNVSRDVLVTDYDYVALQGKTLLFGTPNYPVDLPRYLPKSWRVRCEIDTCFGFLLVHKSNYYHD